MKDTNTDSQSKSIHVVRIVLIFNCKLTDGIYETPFRWTTLLLSPGYCDIELIKHLYNIIF